MLASVLRIRRRNRGQDVLRDRGDLEPDEMVIRSSPAAIAIMPLVAGE
jgi:hypothetical protein